MAWALTPEGRRLAGDYHGGVARSIAQAPEEVLAAELDRFLEVWAQVEGGAVPLRDWEHYALGWFMGAGWEAQAAAQLVATLSWQEPFAGYAEA